MAKNQVWSHPGHGRGLGGLFRKSRALGKHGAGFLPESPGVPGLDPAQFRVANSFEEIVEVDDGSEVGPTRLSDFIGVAQFRISVLTFRPLTASRRKKSIN